MIRLTRLLCMLVALAALSAGCGGSEGDESGPGPGAYGLDTGPEKPPAEPERKERKEGFWGVAFGAEGEHGLLIYDLAGHTLYTFDRDTEGKSSCYGACAKAWPPALIEGKPRAGGEAIPAEVGATKRKDGTVQLTYGGHPLYRFSRDRQGEIKGDEIEAFGGEWHAMRPNGEEL